MELRPLPSQVRSLRQNQPEPLSLFWRSPYWGSMPDLGYIELTPESLSALCLVDAADEIEAALHNPVRWFFAVSKLHRALGCGLIAALRGSDGIGAYDEKTRKKWLEWFRVGIDAGQPAPTANRVDELTKLLERALDPEDPWTMAHGPISLSDEQKADLARLNSLRGNIEHVKPAHWSLEVGGLPRIAAAVAAAVSQLLDVAGIGLHLEDEELEAMRDAVTRIQAVAVQYPSNPPQP